MSYDPEDFRPGWDKVVAGVLIWIVLLAGMAALGPAPGTGGVEPPTGIIRMTALATDPIRRIGGTAMALCASQGRRL